MRLETLLRSSGVLAEVAQAAYLGVDVLAITADSRKVKPGTVFVAVNGGHHRGAEFIDAAVRAGAVAIVADAAVDRSDVTVLRVDDAQACVGPLAAALLDHPSRSLDVVGVTGTNGKTTTTVLIAQLCEAAGFRAAAIGTLGVWTAEGTRPGTMTTPDPADLQALLAGLRDEGFSHVAIEVSSHALDQHRVAGVQFAATAWTNLSRDHLDYHGTQEAYADAKAKLFRDFSAPYAFVNGDDPIVSKVWEEGRAQAWSLGTASAAEHQVRDLRCDSRGLSFLLESPGQAGLRVAAPLLGRHNAENLVAAVLVCRALAIPDAMLTQAMPKLQAPRGRLEPVPNQLGALVTVDYAHTPDALEKVLVALRPLVAPERRLIAVFGCGGDRDRGKRAVMGHLAGQLADLVVLTSDNPRSEQPEAILAEIEAGCLEAGARRLDRVVPSVLLALGEHTGYVVEPDREQAIRRAVFVLQPGDVLLIAGKGHETTQTIGNTVRPFDDAEVARKWLQLHRPMTPTRSRPDGWAFDGPLAWQACGGTLVVAGTRFATPLCTDSRKLTTDALFVALTGERFDGGTFVAQAVAQGAAGIVCQRGHGQTLAQAAAQVGCFVLEVNDTLVALGDLARAHRVRYDLLVVGVTGSNGKTTTKEMIALALAPLGHVLATQGNFNNRIGVPLTLARLDAAHRAAVVEMGMSEPGEIAVLADMARPRIGIVTSIAEAHLQGLGTIDAIANEKAALLHALGADGIAVIPFGDAHIEPIAARLPCRVLRFGRDGGDVRLASPVVIQGLAQRFTVDVAGTLVEVQLPGLGVHLALNALGTLTVALAAGVDLHAAAAGLSRYQPVGQRMLPSRIGPWLVLEDCYNANPRSTETALDTLATLPGPRVAVLGSMLELGAGERALHARVGAHAAESGIDLLIAIGDFAADYASGARSGGVRVVELDADAGNESAAAAARAVHEFCPQAGTILVKGSRGARMERVIAELRALAGDAPSTEDPAPAAAARS